MKEQALVKTIEDMSPKQRDAAVAMARRAARQATQLVNEKLGHLKDPAINIGEKVGGGVIGLGAEMGVRVLVDKLGQPATDGTVNTFGKHKDVWKGVLSLAVGGVGLAANVAISGSPEDSTVRRMAGTASLVTAMFGLNRILVNQLKLPS